MDSGTRQRPGEPGQTASSRRAKTVAAALFAATLAACSSATPTEAPSAAPTDGAPTQGAASPGDELSFDLSGVSIVTTSTLHSGLDASFLRTVDLLQEWGAEVDLPILSQTTGVDAIVAGESNVAGTHAADELIVGASQGADLVGIGSPVSKMDYVMIAQNEYQTVESLEGTTLATSGPGGFNTLLARFTLQDANLDPDEDVTLAQIGSSGDRGSALVAGRASAAVLTMDDWFALQEQTDTLHLLAAMSDVRPEFPNNIYFAERSYWDENPEVALAWACANLESNKWLNEDRQRYADYMFEKVEGRATVEALGETWDFAQEVGMWPTDPTEVVNVEGVQALADILLEVGDITNPVVASDQLDTSYLDEAAAMGCGA